MPGEVDAGADWATTAASVVGPVGGPGQAAAARSQGPPDVLSGLVPHLTGGWTLGFGCSSIRGKVLRSKECRGNHGDAVLSAVGVWPGGDDDGVEQVAAELSLKPLQVPKIRFSG